MAILGRDTASGFGAGFDFWDRLRVYKATLAADGQLDELYGSVRAAGDIIPIRFVLFDDNGAGGDPGSLLAQSADISVPVTGSRSTRGGAVLTPVVLTAGDYWLGIHQGTGDAIQYDDNGSGAMRESGSDTFAGGTASPFTAGTTKVGSMQVWGVLSDPPVVPADPLPFTHIKFGTGLTVTDEGGGVIRVDVDA